MTAADLAFCKVISGNQRQSTLDERHVDIEYIAGNRRFMEYVEAAMSRALGASVNGLATI